MIIAFLNAVLPQILIVLVSLRVVAVLSVQGQAPSLDPERQIALGAMVKDRGSEEMVLLPSAILSTIAQTLHLAVPKAQVVPFRDAPLELPIIPLFVLITAYP